MEFMRDTLFCGHRFLTFNLFDAGARDGGIEVDSSLTAERIVRALDEVGETPFLPD